MRPFVLVLALFVAAPVAAAPAKLVVIAKLVEKPKGIRVCGGIASKAIVRYELVRVVSGEYTRTSLYVGVWCPEALTIGTQAKLALEPLADPKRDGYIDKFGEPSVPRYRAVSIDSP